MLAERRADPRTVGPTTEPGQGVEHRQVGLAATEVLDTLAARDAALVPGRASQLAERGVDEGRLPDPRFARDERQLAVAASCRVQPLGDPPPLAHATDHRAVRLRRATHHEGWRLRAAGHRGTQACDEAVPASRDG